VTLVLIMNAIVGSSFPISKALLKWCTTPFFLTGIRMIFGGGILLAYQYLSPHAYFKFRRKHIWLYAQIMFFSIYLSYVFRFWALNAMPSSKLGFLFNLSPFFAAFYSYIFFNEKISRMQWLGLFIGFVGFFPILYYRSMEEAAFAELARISLPELAAIAAVGLHSYGWIVMRKLVKFKRYDPAMVNGLSMLAGGVLAMATSLWFEGWLPVKNPQFFASWLAVSILVSNVLYHNMYAYLLKKYTATFMSFAGFSTSLFCALYGWAFLNERITWHFWVSAILVLTGLYIFYRHEVGRKGFGKDLEHAEGSRI